MTEATFVCKIGGSIIDGVDPTVIEDIKSLRSEGSRVVLVHGGGDQVTEIAEKLGKKQKFITSPEGIKSRYTDKETAEIFTMVMTGLLAKHIAQILQRNGVNAVSLSGVDGGLLRAVRKKKLIVIDERRRKVAIDGGYTGKIERVESAFLSSLLADGYVPIISPVASGEEFELLNVDGDRACSFVAASLKADAAIFLTDMEGLILDNSVVRELNTEQAKSLLPKIGSGMDKKVMAAIEAVEMGASKSIIASGLKRHPLQSAISGNGTVITK